MKITCVVACGDSNAWGPSSFIYLLINKLHKYIDQEGIQDIYKVEELKKGKHKKRARQKLIGSQHRS